MNAWDRIRIAAGALALLGACSAPPDMTPQEPVCAEGATRCKDGVYQVCEYGYFTDTLRCNASDRCDPDLACVGKGGCTEGSDLIYVVDTARRLLAFNPRNDVHLFKRIGALSCQAGLPLPPRTGIATPNSMSVDRTGRAWVSYTSGELFHVSTTDASCRATTFQRGQLGFKTFGMGFVSETGDPTRETLFLSAVGDMHESGPLARLDAATLQLQLVGTLPMREYSPELTGTGAGDLFGYYPGTAGSLMAKIDKTSGKHLKEWPLPATSDEVTGLAFAHWGGRFYIFLTTQDKMGNRAAKVARFDPANGSYTVVVPYAPYDIVGAGVSTCAPVILG